MKNLGKTEAEMYPSMSKGSKTKKIYPTLRLPLDIVGKDAELGDEVTLKIKAKIKGLENTEYSKEVTFQATEAEVV